MVAGGGVEGLLQWVQGEPSPQAVAAAVVMRGAGVGMPLVGLAVAVMEWMCGVRGAVQKVLWVMMGVEVMALEIGVGLEAVAGWCPDGWRFVNGCVVVGLGLWQNFLKTGQVRSLHSIQGNSSPPPPWHCW